MTLFQFLPVRLTIFLVIGIVLGYYQDPGPAILLLILMALLCALAILHFRSNSGPRQTFGVCVAASMIVLGMATISMQRAFTYRAIIDVSDSQKKHLWVLKIREELKSSSYYRAFIAKVESVDGKRAGGSILCRASIETFHNNLNVDDQISIRANLEEIELPKNPYQFNYKNYMQNLGVYHKINLTNVPFLSHSSDERTLIGLAARTRGKIIADLKKLAFGKTERSIIRALLLGDRTEIDQATFKSYKNAGAIHILAISGLHVGIVLL
ncbi:MAG: ComEC/Rec2 family competence protein, partial [Flavobacteriaceae bacterium]